MLSLFEIQKRWMAVLSRQPRARRAPKRVVLLLQLTIDRATLAGNKHLIHTPDIYFMHTQTPAREIYNRCIYTVLVCSWNAQRVDYTYPTIWGLSLQALVNLLTTCLGTGVNNNRLSPRPRRKGIVNNNTNTLVACTIPTINFPVATSWACTKKALHDWAHHDWSNVMLIDSLLRRAYFKCYESILVIVVGANCQGCHNLS